MDQSTYFEVWSLFVTIFRDDDVMVSSLFTVKMVLLAIISVAISNLSRPKVMTSSFSIQRPSQADSTSVQNILRSGQLEQKIREVVSNILSSRTESLGYSTGKLVWDRFDQNVYMTDTSGRKSIIISPNGNANVRSMTISGTSVYGVLTHDGESSPSIISKEYADHRYIQSADLANYVTHTYLSTNYYTKGVTDGLLTGYYLKTDLDAKLASEYYTKGQLDYMFLGVVSYSWLQLNHYDKTQIDSLLTGYYTKIQTNSLLSTKLNVETFNDEMHNIGMTYQKIADMVYFPDYMYLSTNHYTKTETSGLLASYYTKVDIDNRLTGYYYTKDDSDNRYLQEADLDDYVTKPLLSTTLSTYYTGPQVDSLLDNYATKAYMDLTRYTKTECDNTFLTKTDAASTYQKKNELIDTIYPIGSVYTTYDSSFDPNTAWSGTTWTPINGRFLYSDHAGTPGATGGAYTVTLTADHIPQHTHPFTYVGGTYFSEKIYNSITDTTRTYDSSTQYVDATTGSQNGHSGTQSSFSIMPPHVFVRSWRRTA